MPWMVPSHPAPILPLKMWKPALFSGLALCLGAVAPDLEFVMLVKQDWIVSHTVAGQLFFTLPVVLALYWALTAVVLPWLVPLLPLGAPWHLEDLAHLRPPSRARDWVRVAVSGLIGGFSHIFIDGFTHGTHSGWAVPLIPVLATPIALPAVTVPLHDLLQVGLTIVLGALGIRQAAAIARRRLLCTWTGNTPARPREATPFERRGAIGYFLLCLTIGINAGIRRSTEPWEWVELGAFGAIAFVSYGLLLAAALDRVRLTFGSMRRPAPEPSES